MRKIVCCPISDGTDFKNRSQKDFDVEEIIQLSMLDLMDPNQQAHFLGTIS